MENVDWTHGLDWWIGLDIIAHNALQYCMHLFLPIDVITDAFRRHFASYCAYIDWPRKTRDTRLSH